MENILCIMIIISLLGTGYVTANILLWPGSCSQQRRIKIAAWGAAVLLPLLLLTGVRIYNGIARCSYCKSITVNSYNENKWITDVGICRKCVEYIDVCRECVRDVDREDAKLFKKPDKKALIQYRCRRCDGDINMHDDEEEELFCFIALIFISIGHFATLLVMGIIALVKNRKISDFFRR